MLVVTLMKFHFISGPSGFSFNLLGFNRQINVCQISECPHLTISDFTEEFQGVHTLNWKRPKFQLPIAYSFNIKKYFGN